MQTRLGQYADKAIEIGWLASIIFVPLYFNVYSSRVFEPDKISTLRTFVLLMLVAWIIKLGESGWRGWRESAQASSGTGATQSGRASKVVGATANVVETATPGWLPSWLGFLRIPMVLAILVYALFYFVSSIFSVTPDATWWGSYQRGQGTYTQYSYMMLGIIVLANLRTRPQLDRIINFMLLTSVPVALYGVLQALHADPLPWAGDTSTRVASSMGNAIFVAAWLIMIVPFTIYRIFTGISSALAARSAADTVAVEAEPEPRARAARRTRQSEGPSYGWAVVANCAGVLIASLLLLYMSLKMMAGLPYPDGRTWFIFPFMLIIFGLGGGLIEWLGKRADDPAQTGMYMPLIGGGLFLISLLALPLQWNLAPETLAVQMDFDAIGLIWVAFFILLWASIAAGAFALAGVEREEGYADKDRGIVRASLNVGYAALLLVQLICIYLTQSRGPWLGLGVGIVTIMVALWLIGRARDVNWMRRIGGIASAMILVLVLFVGALNIPGSPLTGLSNLPLIGRGIERLSTLTRTEDGTGRVRSLIWEGATQLIISDPARSIIGWGPESMYVAYNRFYPAELSQVELRNATPDRSHNVEFDQLVTLGALGLMMYYFLVGSFFFYGLRMVKRATNTTDQLFGITLLAAIASHFVEIQTGIQIASTWSYFYLIVGMMVAFGFYMNGYLRGNTEAAAVDVPQPANKRASNGVEAAASEEIGEEARPVAVGAGARTSAESSRSTATMQVGGNGSGSGKAGASGQNTRRMGGTPTVPTSQGRGAQAQGNRGNGAADTRRPRASVAYTPNKNTSGGGEWLGNPAMLALYGLATVIALFIAWTVNAANVQADTLFKQAQAYDNATRYFLERDANQVEYPGSISFYEKAIALQPNQDYFYLFLGRAYLESAKAVDQEPYNRRLAGVPGSDPRWADDAATAAQQKATEKLVRLRKSEEILSKANQMSPYNTDHYANLGRLYLYWADSTGMGDATKAPLAVQWMQAATQHTPGNAQLWFELAVAYSRDNKFDDAIAATRHSEELDPTYGRPPLVRGQLYQERAENVKNDLINGDALPTDGDVDYGRLVVEAGKAYSDTAYVDPTQIVDTQYQSRVDFLLNASKPFTNTNSTVSAAQLSTVITDTLLTGLKNDMDRQEIDMANHMRERGASVPNAHVDDATLQTLWADPKWSNGQPDGSGDWIGDDIRLPATRAALDHYGMGVIHAGKGDKEAAIMEYTRALLLRPGFSEAVTALQDAQKLP